MPRPNAASRRLGSLPAKVALAVLLAITLRGLLVGGASVSFARDFFQQIVELTFPAQIERTARRVDAWLAAGHGHVKLLADDPRVLRGSDAARQELEVQLTESGILDALWIVKRDGSVQLIAGEPPPANLPASLSEPGIHALPRDAAPTRRRSYNYRGNSLMSSDSATSYVSPRKSSSNMYSIVPSGAFSATNAPSNPGNFSFTNPCRSIRLASASLS